MPSAHVALTLSLLSLALALGMGCSETLESVLREAGQPALREMAAEDARGAAERGAVLVQPWPPAPGEIRVPLASPLRESDAAPEGPGLIVVVGDSPAAWALAARLRRSGTGPVAIAPARAEDWPRPRAQLRKADATDDPTASDSGGVDARGW